MFEDDGIPEDYSKNVSDMSSRFILLSFLFVLNLTVFAQQKELQQNLIIELGETCAKKN